jgi:hypothetical protein
MAGLLPFLREFGLPGAALAVLGYVVARAVPQIKDGIVQDRRDRPGSKESARARIGG